MCCLPSDTARGGRATPSTKSTEAVPGGVRNPGRLFRRAWPLLLVLAPFFAACAAPRGLPSGPTPIPTLIPVTDAIGLLGTTPTPSFAILSYPAQLPSAGLGRPLYETHCASCHGEDGKGVVPGARNFSDLDYMRGETPAFFYTAVTEGRGEMPSFREQLTSDERWDAVFYVWRFSTSAETLALGETIYGDSCAACHGAAGAGQVLGAADFTDLRFTDARAPRDFYLVVTQGKGSMPAWQGRLSQDERWAVIDYLRAFSYDPALAGEAVVAAPPTAASAAVCDATYLTQSNPFAWEDATAVASGEAIYKEACEVCHAADGSGTLPSAPDFSTAEFQSELRSSQGGELLCVVAEGRGAMPGWKETLTPEQVWEVLTFLASLGK